MQKQRDRKFLPLPAWIFLAAMAVYHELMLHIWVTQEFSGARLLAVLLFAAGFGAVLGLLVGLIPSETGAKWTAVGVSALLTVLWMTEYCVSDAYKFFMSPKTILGGAGGVAQDYVAQVFAVLVPNLWRVGLLLAPTVLYAIFCRTGKTTWALRGILAGAAVACYLLGVGVVHLWTPDALLLTRNYEFDTAVRSFGLHMGFALEMTHGAGGEEPDFVAVVETTAPTVPTESREPQAEETEVPTEPPIVYGDNVLPGVNLQELGEKPENRAVKAIYDYAAAQTPTKQNEYTGLFKGKNLILITAEAFTAEVIDPQRTPALYRMANEGIRFEEYYQPGWGASTTAGEFSNLIGIVPTNGGACMKEALQQKLVFTMGYQLSREGYYSIAYHNHFKDFYDRDKTHFHLGYDQFLARFGGLEGITPVWPESDLEMIDITVPQYIDHQPFSIYYMTVSGHCPYSLKENAQTRKHIDEFADMDHSDTVKGYYASQQELEAAMASLLRQLEEAGIADDTVVVLSTDHYPYGLERSRTWQNTRDHLAELFGVKDYDNFMRDHNALIIWSGCLEGKNIVVEDPVYSLDILPTLSNLFGVEYDSRLLVGRDVFSDAEPLVLWPDHSWITDKGSYNSRKNLFIPRGTEPVEEGYVERINAVVSNKITFSRSVIDHDFYNNLAADIGR